MKETEKNQFYHLLSPLKIRNFVLKNRMESSNSTPHFLQGPEPYPADGLFNHYVNRARNGASIVTVSGMNTLIGMPPNMPKEVDITHFPDFDLYQPSCQNYLMQLAEAIHYYGSLISAGIFSAGNTYPLQQPDGSIKNIPLFDPLKSHGMMSKDNPFVENMIDDSISIETMELIAESFAQQAAIFKWIGFDMCTLHMCYRAQVLGQFISSATNKKTDKFGGDIKGRSQFPLMVFKKIREAVGNDFLIEIQISAEEQNGNTQDEVIQFLKMAEPYVDIAQIRCGDGDPNHPTGYNLEETPFLHYAEYIKKSGVKMAISSVGGYLDPDISENAIKEGKVDLIAMARAWISNPTYGQLIQEGKVDDIVPCLRCNKCHGRGQNDPFVSVCSVNPLLGIEHKIELMTSPVKKYKKVAIIGGGPASMRCALYLKERGHTPVIYEKSDSLGGAIKHSDYADFKWPLKNFKNYLIYQINKHNIEVHLNYEVTPEIISGQHYDVVIPALGATPVLPPITGLKDKTVSFYEEAFTHPEELGENVVIIGGGEVGVEIGIYLAKKQHNATVIEMREKLAADSTLIHYYSMMQEAWEKEANFHGIVNATITKVEDSTLEYLDENKNSVKIPYDSIVIAAGMKPNKDQALAFYGTAKEFYILGDCGKNGTIQQAMRQSYSIANQI